MNEKDHLASFSVGEMSMDSNESLDFVIRDGEDPTKRLGFGIK